MTQGSNRSWLRPTSPGHNQARQSRPVQREWVHVVDNPAPGHPLAADIPVHSKQVRIAEPPAQVEPTPAQPSILQRPEQGPLTSSSSEENA